MTFINSSGAKKFKPAWQPVDSETNNTEEKENSADQDNGGKLNSNSTEKYQKQEHASSTTDR